MIHCEMLKEAHELAKIREMSNTPATKEEIEEILLKDMQNKGLNEDQKKLIMKARVNLYKNYPKTHLTNR